MTKVCRLCLAKLQRGSKYFNINAVESFTGFMPYRDQLTTCIPEMALDLIPNPVICNNCRTALKSSYDFKSRCLMVEKKIRNYVASQPSEATGYNLSEIDTSSLPKSTKFEGDIKEPPKLVPILPRVEVQRVPSSQQSSILSNLLTVKDEVILPPTSEIEITNVGFTTTPARTRGPPKHPRESSSTEITYTPIEKDEHGLYKCNHCDKKFPNVPSLHTHKTRVHEEDYLCNFCNVPFKTLQNLRKHNQQCQKMRTTPPSAANSVLTKRPHLPTKAKNHLKRWLFNHTDHPYPTDVEKQQLMKETNLSLLQVENWFINARRRILADLTKLKNMRGIMPRSRGRGRGRGGHGGGRPYLEVEETELFEEENTELLFDEDEEEASIASQHLKDLEDKDTDTAEDSQMDAADDGEGEADTLLELPVEFLEETQDEEIHQEEEITISPLEEVMESSMSNKSNGSTENTNEGEEDGEEEEEDEEEEDPLEGGPSSHVKMEIEIDER